MKVDSTTIRYTNIFKYNENFNTTNTASGIYSHAEGYLNISSGSYAHSEGYNTGSSGSSSHTEGSSTSASGSCAHAEGYNTRASGSYSHAEGYNSTASGNYSHSEGYYTTASGPYSHSGGYYTTADKMNMTAIGKHNVYNSSDTSLNNNKLFVVGNGTSTSARSDALAVKDDGSIIINSTLSGTNPSLIIGNNNIVSGKSSLAQGEDTYAYGNYSLATGLGTIASSKCQTAIGKYNTTNPMSQDVESRLFVVGNGNNDNDRSDAFTVYNSGEFGHNDIKMYIGNITMSAYYNNSNHDITTFGVAYMTSDYKYCYLSNFTVFVRFSGQFIINYINVNGNIFSALDPSKNRGGGFATVGGDYQLNNVIRHCTLTYTGDTYYSLRFWMDATTPVSNFSDHYYNISFYNCIFQDASQYN